MKSVSLGEKYGELPNDQSYQNSETEEADEQEGAVDPPSASSLMPRPQEPRRHGAVIGPLQKPRRLVKADPARAASHAKSLMLTLHISLR